MCNERKRRRSEKMRNYRAKIKCRKVSETERRLKLDAQKSYMKEYRKRKSANTNDIDKLKNRAKQNNYSRQYGKKKLLSINETEKLKKKDQEKRIHEGIQEKNEKILK